MMIQSKVPFLLLAAMISASAGSAGLAPVAPPAGSASGTSGAFVEVQGKKLWFRFSGAGPNLLLLHGGLTSSECFAALLPELARHFRVLEVDRVGHGRSPDDGAPFVYSVMAEEMKAVLDKLGVTSTSVLGWSDGGVVGYQLASRYPTLVTRLVALGANVRVDGMSPETVRWLESRTTPESLVADLPSVVDEYRKISPNPERLFEFLMRSRALWLRDPYLTPAELKRIEAPVLLVAGDRRDIRVEHLLEIRAALSNARLGIVPGSSHFVLREKPHLLLPMLLDFLLPGAEPTP